jgi:hypothetical protein
METLRADFTNTFRALGTPGARDEFLDPAGYDAWERDWRARLVREGATPEDRRAAMEAANPAVIPRNHRVEEAIAPASGRLRAVPPARRGSGAPFEDQPENADLRRPPAEDEVVGRPSAEPEGEARGAVCPRTPRGVLEAQMEDAGVSARPDAATARPVDEPEARRHEDKRAEDERPIDSPSRSQPKNTPKTGPRKLKAATDEAG